MEKNYKKSVYIVVTLLLLFVILLFFVFDIFLSDELITYTNPSLPYLELKYPKNWNIEVKEFSDTNNDVFTSVYLPVCDNNCMGIRLSKNEISLDIIFVVALDDYGQKCSNSVTYQEIGNGWVRVLDDSRYFYSKNYVLNTVYTGETEALRNLNDNWSITKNEMYEICISGTGYFRESLSNINGDETAILVEDPVINGNPNKETLSVIDEIVKSLN